MMKAESGNRLFNEILPNVSGRITVILNFMKKLRVETVYSMKFFQMYLEELQSF
jgi:hypothetical protein